MCWAIPSGRALFASEPSQPRVFVSAHSGNDPYRNVVSDGQGERFPLEPAEQHQGLRPCHPALAAEGSGARGGGTAPHSPAEAVSGGGGVQGCAPPVLPFAGTVKLFRRAGSAALDRIGYGADGLDQAEQEQRFQGLSEHGSAL